MMEYLIGNESTTLHVAGEVQGENSGQGFVHFSLWQTWLDGQSLSSTHSGGAKGTQDL